MSSPHAAPFTASEGKSRASAIASEFGDVKQAAAAIETVVAQMESVIRGKREVVRLALTTLVAGGHLLLEDVPGVGKTTLALALARSLGAEFRRVQFTNDTLPSDVLGVSVFNPQTAAFEFRAGPIFAGVVLADEINRTSPKTQSALLEAMTERRVSVDGVTRPLPEPFMVIATQNPVDHFGTFPLPESQLDRFLARTRMGYPDPNHERAILVEDIDAERTHDLKALLSLERIRALQRQAAKIHLDATVVDYVLGIVRATRAHDRVGLGVSPRGGLLLKRAAQARALMEGRDYVVPEDVRELAVPVLSHRLALKGRSRSVGDVDEAENLMREIVRKVTVPT